MTENKRKDQDWMDLCSWVEKEIMNFDNNQHLQKKSILILRGLEAGQNIRNKKCEEFGQYPYDIILLTFKANKVKILNAIRNKNFEGESNKMAYVCAIVRDNINEIYQKYLNAQKTQEKVESVDTSIMTYEGAEYKSHNTERKINKRLEGLW